MKDNFTCYSPESFIKIENGKIRSFPMKGTINASEENAENKILSNRKEMAEHATIVDLIRNDLSMVAKDVQVEKFSYVEKIITHEKQLLQVSSSIAGKLPDEYSKRIGTIIFTLLPAGSVSGAPKKKTLEIITESETHERGYYTGIAGIFDGKNLDSCVLIRFIEQENGNLFFRSGGGITVNSDPHSEYQEMIDKIYVPII
jgi:para-aminobenzoate synthetase component 1